MEVTLIRLRVVRIVAGPRSGRELTIGWPLVAFWIPPIAPSPMVN